MGLLDLIHRWPTRPLKATPPREPPRFGCPDGEIAGPFPPRDALQAALGLRCMVACDEPFVQPLAGPPRSGTLWVASIQPSFHAWAELGFVRTTHEGNVVGYRVGMVVGGCPEATACSDFVTLDEPRFELPPQLWPPPPRTGQYDGCVYDVSFRVGGADVSVRLPQAAAFARDWERQLVSTARLLVTATKNEALGAYLDVWGEYLLAPR